MSIQNLRLYFSRLKKSTGVILGAFLFNMTLVQVTDARDFFVQHALPLMAKHPKLAGNIVSLMGVAITLHRPMVQKYLRDIWGKSPDVLVEPGTVVNGVEVITK